QTGWRPIDIDYASVDPTKSCLDKFRIGEVNSTTRPSYTGTPYAGMLNEADGVCDLQEALELTQVNLGSDNGTTDGAKNGAIPTALLADLTNAQELLQMVRGYCYATSTGSDGTGTLLAHPSDATKCNFF